MKTVLELEFIDDIEKRYRIKLDEPREDLTSSDVSVAMTKIIETETFTNGGRRLEQMAGARKITTSIEELSVTE